MDTKAKFELKLGLATREAFEQALVEAGRKNKNVMALDADLSKFTFTHPFAKEFPDRFVECGIAEANMIAIPVGLASSGKIPFRRKFLLLCHEQGLRASIEDLGLACSLPGFTVLSPADEVGMRALVHSRG